MNRGLRATVKVGCRREFLWLFVGMHRYPGESGNCNIFKISFSVLYENIHTETAL